MARKPAQTENESSTIAEADLPGLPAMVDAANALAAADIAVAEQAEAILAAGIDIGRIDALGFLRCVADSAMLAVFEKVKKSKAWRNIKTCDGRSFENLEDFCEAKLGRSYRRLQEIASNRNALGQEAFEQAEQLGLRQIDYKLLKALPAPKQEIVREALTDGASKEEVQRALRELAAADQKEIDDLTDRLTNEKTRLGIEEEARSKAEAENTRLKLQLKKKIVADTDWPDALLPIGDQIAAAGRKMAQALSELETCRITLFEVAQDIPEDQRPKYDAALGFVAESYETALARAERDLGKERTTFEKSLGAYTD
jgi:hypothetical protein